ncbi:MAG TPA: fused MFS/spermidine synthase [Candidatus Dormibacteraeota bacterium]
MSTRAGWILLLVAFVGGLTSLGLEIAASRLLAPYFGTSTYIWGALIGLILLYLTVGYYVGGAAADRWPRPDYLYAVTAVAAIMVLLIPVVSRPILLFSEHALNPGPGAGYNVPGFVGALVAVIVLFAPSVILLGMVSPWVIRLRVGTVAESGRAAGQVYALSTAGSILGAFLPAFWWVPSYGTRATILGLGGVLLLVSLLGWFRGTRRAPAAALAAGLVAALASGLSGGQIKPATAGRLIYEAESEYGYIQVVQTGSRRELILNEGQAVHSIYDPGTLLTGGYWDLLTTAPLLGYRPWQGQRPKRALILGLAGGTVARQLTAAYGASLQIDGVEIDPRIVSVGQQYFAMTEPNLHPVVADGRYFLDTTSTEYDLILVDVYRQPYIPFQFTTREFFLSVRRHLSRNGVVAVNTGRAPGDYRLVDAISGTMGSTFPEVYQQDTPQYLNTVIYAPNLPTQPDEVRTNLDRAAAGGLPLVTEIVAESRDKPILHVEPHYPIYTDDLAPVERLVDNIIYRVVAGSGS